MLQPGCHASEAKITTQVWWWCLEGPGGQPKHRWPVLHAQPGPGFDPEAGQQKKKNESLLVGENSQCGEEGGRQRDFIYAVPLLWVRPWWMHACIDVWWGHVDRIAVGEGSGWLPVACISNFPDKTHRKVPFLSISNTQPRNWQRKNNRRMRVRRKNNRGIKIRRTWGRGTWLDEWGWNRWCDVQRNVKCQNI